MDHLSMTRSVRRLMDVTHHLRQHLEMEMRGIAGPTFEGAMVLCFIENAGGQATIRQIADEMSRASHTITNTVNRLQTRDLVARTRGASGDGRNVQVSLTGDGELMLKRCQEVLATLTITALFQKDSDAGARLDSALDTLEKYFVV